MRKILTLLLVIIILFKNQACNPPAGFVEILLAENLNPVSMTIDPEGRIFIGEKNGRVLVLDNGEISSIFFMELLVDNYNERGLSGIAFDPHYEHNNYFYVFYTVPGANHNRVSRFKTTHDYAIMESEEILIDIDPLSGTIHNGGALRFGKDGKLYVSVGDGSNASNASSLTNLNGKILRINPDGTIPQDNPFYTTLSGKYRAIYALGFRNSFTMDIDPKTGRIYANDVGNSNWEEVNEIIAGANYGWPTIEGKRSNQAAPANYQDPIYTYPHSQGCAVVGAAFYNPANPTFPSAYQGRYFFGDYCEGYIKVINPETKQVEGTFMTGIDRPVAFSVGSQGELYYLERAGMGGGSEQDNTSSSNGKLWKVIYSPGGAPFISVQPKNTTIAKNEKVTFSISALGENLSYQWYRNDEKLEGKTSPTVDFFDVEFSWNGSSIHCEVWNSQDTLASNSAVLTVIDGQRPTPTIITPEEGELYRAGTILSFSGTAQDLDEGTLNPAQLTWRIDFHHDEHAHPGLNPTSGISEGKYSISQTGETSPNVWFRIYLTATDQSGLKSTVIRDIFPLKSKTVFMSDPPGMEILLDGSPIKLPQTISHVVGLKRSIEAPGIVVTDEGAFSFQRFEPDTISGNTLELEVNEAEDTLTVVYEVLASGDGTGLRGEYYLTNFLPFDGVKVGVKIDETIDFDWGANGPSILNGRNDNFAVRWSGYVEPWQSGVYTFTTISDDGVRLWVNDQLIINKWFDQAPTEWSGSTQLEKGNKHKIKLEYYEKGGGAVIQLKWSNELLDARTIPSSQLYPQEEEVLSILSGTDQLYPNPATTQIRIPLEWLGKEFELITLTGISIKKGILSKSLDLSEVSPGIYILHTDVGKWKVIRQRND